MGMLKKNTVIMKKNRAKNDPNLTKKNGSIDGKKCKVDCETT